MDGEGPDAQGNELVPRRRTPTGPKGNGAGMKTTNLAKLEGYRAANLQAARIIASDPAKYPPDSLPGIWARLVLGAPRATPAPSGTEPNTGRRERA